MPVLVLVLVPVPVPVPVPVLVPVLVLVLSKADSSAERAQGGNDGMKGDMRMLEVMPSDALAAGATIVGTGATPEGIDQNPAYYEYTFDTAWNAAAQPLDGWFASYASRRYGNTANADAAAAWKILSTAVSTITCKPAAVSLSCVVTPTALCSSLTNGCSR